MIALINMFKLDFFALYLESLAQRSFVQVEGEWDFY